MRTAAVLPCPSQHPKGEGNMFIPLDDFTEKRDSFNEKKSP